MDEIGALIDRGFCERDALLVARDLIGAFLWHGDVVLRIVETEAYRWPDDTANHCRAGRTPRNAPMWGRAGYAYVYVCYGQHAMLNVVTDREGEGAAVLVRACEPVAGIATIAARRRGLRGPTALAGPGRVAAALALDRSFSGHDLLAPGGLELRFGPAPKQLACGARVGIDYAAPEHRDAPWRFADADSRFVSHRRTLTPTER